MAALIWLFDLTLGLSLLVLAFYIVNSASVYRAVVMFMIFGLLAALAWARLHAGDIALAEAAIGAGVTGALLLNTIGRLRNLEQSRSVPPPRNPLPEREKRS
jgi:uncharacterized MnhB-related membrane protein